MDKDLLSAWEHQTLAFIRWCRERGITVAVTGVKFTEATDASEEMTHRVNICSGEPIALMGAMTRHIQELGDKAFSDTKTRIEED